MDVRETKSGCPVHCAGLLSLEVYCLKEESWLEVELELELELEVSVQLSDRRQTVATLSQGTLCRMEAPLKSTYR